MDDSCVTRVISLCKRIVSSFSYSWKNKEESWPNPDSAWFASSPVHHRVNHTLGSEAANDRKGPGTGRSTLKSPVS